MNTAGYLKKLLEDWEHSALEFLPKIFLALLVISAFYLLARAGKRASRKFYSKTLESYSGIAQIIAAAIYFFLLLSGVFLALEILGLEQVLTKLLAGAGIIGIIAGFAFKDIASNAFAGLLLSIQRPIKIGDWVKMDNAYGAVLRISWITTVIENTEGQEVFVPNQLIYSSTFSNYTTLNTRRIVLRSGVPLTSDLEHVRSIAIEEAAKFVAPSERKKVDFYYTDIGDNGFQFELSFWIDFTTESAYRQAISDAIIAMKKRFELEKISFFYIPGE